MNVNNISSIEFNEIDSTELNGVSIPWSTIAGSLVVVGIGFTLT